MVRRLREVPGKRRPRRGIPAIRCTASAKYRDGQPCRNWAIPGTVVCYVHGAAASQIERKAEVTMTLAQLMNDDPRHPWEVVLDATHVADSLMREAKATLDASGELPLDQLARLVEATKLAHHMASVAITTKAHEQLTTSVQRRLELEGKLVFTAMEGVIDALTLAIDPRYTEDVRIYLHTAARDRLLATDDGETPELPPLPFRLAIAPAIEGEVLSSNPVIDDDRPHSLSSSDIARDSSTVDLEERRARPCRLSSFTDDELADEVDRRLNEREAHDAG
jgi:hypothetical protein